MAIAINGLDGNPLTSRDVDAGGLNHVVVRGRFGFSGNYSTGGDTVDFTTVADKLESSTLLGFVAWSVNGALGANYVPVVATTPALATSKLKIQTAASGFATELGAGAYPAAVTNDIVEFEAIFRKFL